jgi:hypothetical protein
LHQLLDLPLGTTRALIITPTRELAQQIDDVCLGLAYHTPLRVGGAAMGPQEKALRAGVEILLATPGRLLDHMRKTRHRFDQLHTLVLDEADRMLDMGFLPDLKRIIARLPAREQTLLFSATMPPVIAGASTGQKFWAAESERPHWSSGLGVSGWRKSPSPFPNDSTSRWRANSWWPAPSRHSRRLPPSTSKTSQRQTAVADREAGRTKTG